MQVLKHDGKVSDVWVGDLHSSGWGRLDGISLSDFRRRCLAPPCSAVLPPLSAASSEEPPCACVLKTGLLALASSCHSETHMSLITKLSKESTLFLPKFGRWSEERNRAVSIIIGYLLLFALDRHVQQVKGVPNQVELDTLVEGAVCSETGQVIHFDEPRFQLLIDHDVQAKDLETHRVFEVVWLAGSVGV